MKPLGSVAGLVAAIREDGAAEVERIERDCAAEIAQLERTANASGDDSPDDDPRVAAARREAAEARARGDWDDASALLSAREQFLAEVAAEGRCLLAARTGTDRLEMLVRLAREGIEQLPGARFVVEVDPADAPLLDDKACAALAAGTRRDEVRVAPVAGLGGGCIVRSLEGRSWFDNRLEERARRLEGVWRSLVARRFWP